MRLPGARGAGIVDWTSGLALGAIGDSPNGDHEATAAEVAELARMAAEHRAFAPVDDGGHGPGGATGTGTEYRADGGTQSEPYPRSPAQPYPRPHPSPNPDPSPSPHSYPYEGVKALPVDDVIVTNRDSYHIVRFVRTTFDSSVFIHLWLGRDDGNLALARIRLGEMAERLVL
nr:hypothetical protein [Streptomyces tsukubensis]